MADVNNYGDQDVRIWGIDSYDGSVNEVQVKRDGRLKVEADWLASVNNTYLYSLRTLKDDTEKDFVNDDWIEIFNIAGEGRAYYLYTEFYNSNWEIKIEMDGVVACQLTQKECKTYALSDRTAVGYNGNAPYRRSSDVFIWHFPPMITFETSFKYSVRRYKTSWGAGFDDAFLLYGMRVQS